MGGNDSLSLLPFSKDVTDKGRNSHESQGGIVIVPVEKISHLTKPKILASVWMSRFVVYI